MYEHQFQYYLAQLVRSDLFQQLAPLVVFLLIPALVLTANAHRTTLLRPFSMVLEAISLALPWNWSNGRSSPGSSPERRKLKKKIVRTRAEQLGLNGDAAGSSKDAYEDEGQYPGIVNISGTYCFMDSTLQAMASLCYLQPYVDEVHSKAVELDVPSYVIDALRDILHALNTPRPSPRPLRPVEIINALANHSKGKHNALFSSREHQDAQELFQLLSEAIKSEATAVHKEGLRDRGLGALAHDPEHANKDLIKGVFDGLTANRRSCLQCGYTEAVMHFAFDNLQLAVPRQAICRLEECLADYTRLEVLTDCICRKCSMVATAQRLEQEAKKLTEATNGDADPSSSKRRRAREARKLAGKMKAALEEGRIEEDIKGVKLEKVTSPGSTKQAMIARPPPVLALHLNRSVHFGHYATKNNCRVHFPEVLDLTPFTTSGKLSTSPSSPISAPPPPLPLTRSTTPTPATYASQRVLYRLAAVVCHYGQHSFGHYVCFRRKPRPPSFGSRRYTPPKQQCPLGCDCQKCERYGPIREDDGDPPNPAPGEGRGWLRISDDSVAECGMETVIQEGSGAFMLYYERITHEGVYGSSTPRASEETLKPPVAVYTNGNEGREESVDGTEDERASSSSRLVGARIVRNVTAQRAKPSRSPSRTYSSDSALSLSRASTKEPEVQRPRPVVNGDAHRHASQSRSPSRPVAERQSSGLRVNGSAATSPPPSSSASSSASPPPSTPRAPVTLPRSYSSQDGRARGHRPEPPVRSSSQSRALSPSRHHRESSTQRIPSLPAAEQGEKQASVRMKAPQPLHAAATVARSLSPPRTVALGLRA